MMADWQDIGCYPSQVVLDDTPRSCLAQWLDSKGLGTWADKILEVSGAESLEDLKLVDTAMAEEIIVEAGLKLVAAKKLRIALAELRAEPPVGGGTAMAKALEARPEQVPLQECVAICIDRSGSMRSPFNEITINVVKGESKDSVAQRTRMEAVKAMFYAFRDRIESLGAQGSHKLGLIQFDNRIEHMLELTPQLDLFESIVDDIEPRGQTAIYSSIAEAAQMLQAHFSPGSGTDLRILVLTDGQSNTGSSPEEALQEVHRIGAVVDAIIVGDSPDANLRKIVTASEGECYQIDNLGEGFELLESEGVVSLRARRGGTEKSAFKLREMIDFNSLSQKEMTRGSAVQRAPVLDPALASKTVADVSTIRDAATSTSLSGGTAKRVLQEIKQVASASDKVWVHSGQGIHIFPAPDSINFWRVLIEGPPGSPFEDGVFHLNVIIPDSYPFRPPQIVFETPVYHCNVSDSGKICIDVLQEGWNPALSVPKALEAIREMLKNPDTDNSLRQWIAELTIAYQKSGGADARYLDNARECARQHAACSVEEWKRRWAC
eukprot:TRINITY_DN32854_c0_g1_i1.p1 TRINITY_DN32854_c0_g1~~TRINITY_DN32854_c0_g1_i1.p1  ORF type:complete len:549 (+),score=105.95 TRINITY_DN32854_c0_g1_i1:73-1719(+)